MAEIDKFEKFVISLPGWFLQNTLNPFLATELSVLRVMVRDEVL